eukprot:3188038-Amphidinium_carterae.1
MKRITAHKTYAQSNSSPPRSHGSVGCLTPPRSREFAHNSNSSFVWAVPSYSVRDLLTVSATLEPPRHKDSLAASNQSFHFDVQKRRPSAKHDLPLHYAAIAVVTLTHRTAQSCLHPLAICSAKHV